ncbi:MAG TPA: hypothetical protein VHG30_00500 [Microvirga sp.]|nr:hypothetical protein [Microvirga sp.]
MGTISRRCFLAGIAAAAGAAAGPAFAQAVPALASVQVDVGPLRAAGYGLVAEIVGAAMTDELRRVFADRLVGRGPRLLVRIREVYLTASLRSGSSRDISTDSIDGEALILGPRGEILARYPQFAALGAFARATEPNELGRAEAVARHYARWLRRTMG